MPGSLIATGTRQVTWSAANVQQHNTPSAAALNTGSLQLSDSHAHRPLAALRLGPQSPSSLNPKSRAWRAQVAMKVPLVVRLEGTNVERGKQILEESNVKVITADDLDDAAEKAVQALA